MGYPCVNIHPLSHKRCHRCHWQSGTELEWLLIALLLTTLTTQPLSWVKFKRERLYVMIQLWILCSLYFPIKPNAKRKLETIEFAWVEIFLMQSLILYNHETCITSMGSGALRAIIDHRQGPELESSNAKLYRLCPRRHCSFADNVTLPVVSHGPRQS